MARLVNAAEAYQTVYTAFATVNFSAYDYNTVKQSLLAYVQLYFPEDFNDYIESSEFVAQLELFCYMAELMAYRMDFNAHENFMSTAQRKESVLRLANFISYTPTRNLPARGLVKISSITTSQSVFDSLGRNLSNVKIVWNDTSNTNWQEQFFLVINNVLTEPFGSISPSERVQVGDVLLELYTLNNSPLSTTGGGEVFTYSATAQGSSLPMELVPITLSSNGPVEKRPENNSLFTLMYGNDGLGDGSSFTGFLLYTKQGTLQNTTTSFDGVTPNQTFDIAVNNINDTDVWVNNINPNTGAVLTVNPLPTAVVSLSPGYSTTYGYWYPVNTNGAQNIIFNYTSNNRHQYEIESKNNDQITLIFGDGEMVDVPQGTFEIWYRTSGNTNATIPATAVSNQTASFGYVDLTGVAQTLTFTFSLVSSLQNGSVTETIDHVRNTSPSVFYTQNRMVNAQDYNTYLLQDPSILKLVTFNRTFAGDSKYIAWHDPSESYENVKLFGDDLALYFQGVTPASGKLITISNDATAETVLLNFIQPLLASSDFFTTLAPIYNALGGNPATLRTAFTQAELVAILAMLNNPSATHIFFYFSVLNNIWTTNFGSSPSLPDSSYTYMMVVNKIYSGSNQTGWTIQYASTSLIVQSASTHFWNTNNGLATIDYDTLNSNQDTILILSANIDATGAAIVGTNQIYNVLSQVQSLITPGLPDLTMLSVLPTDTSGDGIPDNMTQSELLNLVSTFTITALTPVNSGRYLITLPRTYIAGFSSTDLIVQVTPFGTTTPITVTNDNLQPFYFNETISPPVTPTPPVLNQIQIGGTITAIPHVIGIGDIITVTAVDYVYLSRPSVADTYKPVLTSDSIKTLWAANASTIPQLQTYVRYPGRYPFNFAWFHQAANFHLIDPAASNIMDMYIITVGYYQALLEWINGQTDIQPTPPTSLDLRTSYATLLNAAMISDTVVLHSGTFQLLFGALAPPTLQGTFKVVRPQNNVTLTDNQVRNKIASIIQDFFDPNFWNFGETFFVTELTTVIENQLASEIDSVVLVPLFSTSQFGDLFEISPGENQLFLPAVTAADVQIVTALTPQVLRQAGF